ncbi:hypothetical protein NP493_21g11061 [Ridgeia piscesae]|uniref:Protein disulfide-isomerase n=1 Tax=Ridgeia piscesae TaxID=27915 RepID=A0AAD9PE70_RIDPI|nr:hypothetical protein NP493_21g11061 [Ridgeia piscesae]
MAKCQKITMGHVKQIDCDGAGKETCSKYKIQGFPTLKIFKDGVESADYKGQRSSDGIVKYMRGKAGPSSKELKTAAEFEKFTGSSEYVILGLFSAEDSALAKDFQKLADAMNEDYRFAHSYSKEVHAKSKYENNVVIYQPKQLHNKFDPKERVYEGSASLTEMKTWVNDNIHGFAGLRTSGNANQFKKPLVVAYYAVDYVKNPKGTNYWRNRVMKVAKKLKDAGNTVYFAVSSKDDFSHELSEYGLTAGDTPVVAARDAKDQKFVMKDTFSMDTLEKFVNSLLAGELKPYLKSEPVPESNDAPVKVVVAETFDEIVNDKTKDVLIEFYAPWCGHCKSLAPKYDELAEKLADEKDIVIAKMDATANDVPAQYSVRGFPTLYFAPKNKKDTPVTYDGGREVKEFIKYLAKEATDPLSGYDRDGKKKKKEEL